MSWETLVEHRRMLRWSAAWLFGFTSVLIGAAANFWNAQPLYSATVTGLLGMQCLQGYWLLGRIVDLQAALDMKRLTKRTVAEQGTHHFFPGDILCIVGTDGSRKDIQFCGPARIKVL